jgi:hypothetical protein
MAEQWAAIAAGMDGGATSDNSAPAATPAADAPQGSEATPAVGDDAPAEAPASDAPVAKEPAAPVEIGDIDISKVDLSKLSPEVRTLVEGYRKSFQGDYTRKMQALKEKEDALQAKPAEVKPEVPTFDEASLASLDGDVVHGPLKQLSAMTKYQDARITDLSERAVRAETMASKITELYLDDVFERQYDQLTGKGGDYESTPLDRAVVMEIIKTSSDPRLGIGRDMVRNAFSTILGPATQAKAAAAKSESKAKTHALPTGGGVAGKALTGLAKISADLMSKWGGDAVRTGSPRVNVQL